MARVTGAALPGMRQVRLAQKIKLVDLASQTNLNRSYLYKLETGRARAGYTTVKIICKHLQTDEGKLMNATAA